MNDSLFGNSEVFMGNFVDAEDIFGDDIKEDVEKESPEKDNENPDTTDNKLPEGEVSAEDLFGDESPESVGDDKDNDKEEKETSPNGDGSSPKGSNLYSSFAQALYGDGLFQFLDEKTVNNVVDADSFSEAFENEVNARLDDVTKRVKEALDSGMQPSVVARYEKIISNLEGITEAQLTAETDEGSNLRRSIIKQDYINRGFSPERAEKQVDRIMSSSGTDIEDAKDALESVLSYFRDSYNGMVESGKAEAEAESETEEATAEVSSKPAAISIGHTAKINNRAGSATVTTQTYGVTGEKVESRKGVDLIFILFLGAAAIGCVLSFLMFTSLRAEYKRYRKNKIIKERRN